MDRSRGDNAGNRGDNAGNRDDRRNPSQRRNVTGVRPREVHRSHSGPPDIRTNIDTSRTRSGNAEQRRPLDYFIGILQNRDSRNYFIMILQDRNCRNLLQARSQSISPEFSETMERALNDYRLRDRFISIIQDQEYRDRFINILQNREQRDRFIGYLGLYLRQGERTPSLASDDGTDDASSIDFHPRRSAAGYDRDWLFEHWATAGDDEISDGAENRSDEGTRL